MFAAALTIPNPMDWQSIWSDLPSIFCKNATVTTLTAKLLMFIIFPEMAYHPLHNAFLSRKTRTFLTKAMLQSVVHTDVKETLRE